MPITTIGLAKVGLYSIPTSRPTPQIIFHWRVDCSRLRDPIGQHHLRGKDGRDKEVQDFLIKDPRVEPILHAIRMIAAERQNWTTIAFHDYHGKWISTAMVELALADLDANGYAVAKSHHSFLHVAGT